METFFERIAMPHIDRGLEVIPLAVRGKAPVGPGAKSRSNSRLQVQAWARLYPDSNVGICSGRDLTILETDDLLAFTTKVREMTGKKIPDTLQGGSGKPNRCFWIFGRTAACGDDCLEVPGLFEFRNRNQYVAAPGSIHPEGYIYSWFQDIPIQPMPNWLVRVLKELDGAYAGRKTSHHQQCGATAMLHRAYKLNYNVADLLIIKDLEIPPSERHYTLVSVAGFLHDGERSADEIAEILESIRDTYFVAAEDKSNDEIQRIAEDVVHREPCPVYRLYFAGREVRHV